MDKHGPASLGAGRRKAGKLSSAQTRTRLAHDSTFGYACGQLKQALSSIEAAVAADPELDRALVWLGMAQLATGQREQAAATLTDALGGDLMPMEQQLATQLLAEAKAPPPQDRLLGAVSVAEL